MNVVTSLRAWLPRSTMPWIVAAVDGEKATGLFAAGGTLVGIANMFVNGLANYLSPKAARSYSEGGVPALRSVLRTTALAFTATIGRMRNSTKSSP